MSRLLAGIACFSLLVWSPAGQALEETDGCKIDGASPAGAGPTCATGRGEWTSITFSVMALCRNSCTGSTWQVNSPNKSLSTNNSCLSCPLKERCVGCVRRISAQSVEVYSQVDKRRKNSNNLCEIAATEKAFARCNCPGCGDPSPILISLSDDLYELTAAADGVLFDLDGDGVAEQTAWTAPGSDEGFLVLDRNLNGQIDDFMEVFGDHTPQLPSDEPNGWLALAVWDDSLNGGNEDGVIDVGDYIFSALQIWVDTNHNGFSEPEELSSLEDEGLEYLSLDYDGSAGWVDDFGNGFRFPSEVGRADGGVITAWDVFFGQQ